MDKSAPESKTNNQGQRSLDSWVGLLSTLLSTLLLITGAAGIYSTVLNSKTIGHFNEQGLQALLRYSKISSLLGEQEYEIGKWVYATNVTQKIGPIESNHTELSRLIEQEVKLSKGSESFEIWYGRWVEFESTVNSTKFNPVELKQAAASIYDQIFALQTAMEIIYAEVEESSEEIHRDSERAVFVAVIGVSMFLVFGIVFSLLATRAIKRRIRKMYQHEKELQNEVVLTSKLASLGELAAGVGHEINNPLAIAMGKVEVVKKEIGKAGLKNMRITEAFTKFDIACKRIVNIVSGLRILARNNESEDDQVFDLCVSTEQTLGLLSEIYEKKGIFLTYELPNEEIWIRGNSGRMQQAIMNLLSNARDAVKDTDKKDIHLKLAPKEGNALVEVRDSGSGIPTEYHDKILNSFFTTKETGEGTGLGLSLTNSIVLEHNGTLSFESQPGRTVFRLEFPVAEHMKQSESLATVHDISSASKASVLSLRVLVVDDEEGLREILREYLEEAGCDVVEAPDGMRALAMAQSQTFDLVITDITMPKMDGFQLAREIRNRNSIETPFMVVITGGVTSRSEDTAKELETLFEEVLYKPFHENSITAIVERVRSSVSKKKAA